MTSSETANRERDRARESARGTRGLPALTSGVLAPTVREGLHPRRGTSTLRAAMIPFETLSADSEHALPRGRLRLLGIAVVTIVVLLQVATQYVANRDLPRTLSQLVYLAVEMPPLMVVLSLVFGHGYRRQAGPARLVASGILVAAVMGALVGALWWLAIQRFPALRTTSTVAGPPTFERSVLYGVAYAQSHFGLWALAFLLPAVVELGRIRALEREKVQLEAEKLRGAAELARLRAHLEPHFLLNTLNAIAGLVTEEPREARRLLAALGDLLRDALRDEDEMQTLDTQVAWLHRYAEILEARHRGGLTFGWDIAVESRNVLLPRLLLQPLVENAVKHGALKRVGGGRVTIRASVAGESMVCVVEDNGPGLSSDTVRTGAFGLKSVRRRLELRYPERARLSLESSGAGTRSIVEVPRQFDVSIGQGT
jgi:signal transduction histidine kinase